MITDVIILSRTKMSGEKICVGGLDLNSGEMLRLLDNFHIKSVKRIL